MQILFLHSKLFEKLGTSKAFFFHLFFLEAIDIMKVGA